MKNHLATTRNILRNRFLIVASCAPLILVMAFGPNASLIASGCPTCENTPANNYNDKNEEAPSIYDCCELADYTEQAWSACKGDGSGLECLNENNIAFPLTGGIADGDDPGNCSSCNWTPRGEEWEITLQWKDCYNDDTMCYL